MFSLFFLCAAIPALVSEWVDTLGAATVVADRGMVVSKTDTLKVDAASGVADLLLTCPSLYVGDYGGFAGLKSVSLRGMGSAHTAIYFDGVRVTNAMSGQSDLGFIAVENISEAVIDYAQNSVAFRTARPSFGSSPVRARLNYDWGSFGTFIPSGRLDFKLNDRLALSANLTGLLTEGNFPLAEGGRRSNNDISQVKGGVDLYGLTRGGRWQAKVYCNSSLRGTPGSVQFPSTDRQKDLNAFAQAVLSNSWGPVYTLDASAKYGYDYLGYESEWGESEYHQRELQVNSSHKFRVSRWFQVSLSADFTWTGLKSTEYCGDRISGDASIAAAVHTGRFSADASLEYNHISDISGKSHDIFSPSVDLKFRPFDGVSLGAFGRRGYRVPTYNELFYPGYGNPDLKPEDAWMTEAGIAFDRFLTPSLRLEVSADGFFNLVTDKIISAPSDATMLIWLPYNVGKSRTLGADFTLHASLSLNRWKFRAGAGYVLQDARDVTPDAVSFGEALVYVARHTVTSDASLEWGGFALNLYWTFKGGRCDSSGPMPDWNTLDASLGKTFSLPESGLLGLHISVRNIFDCRYEAVSGYPMQGRNLLCGIKYEF